MCVGNGPLSYMNLPVAELPSFHPYQSFIYLIFCFKVKITCFDYRCGHLLRGSSRLMDERYTVTQIQSACTVITDLYDFNGTCMMENDKQRC
jgi:hypothetical protein